MIGIDTLRELDYFTPHLNERALISVNPVLFFKWFEPMSDGSI
jgi:hypothetical protein